MKNANKVILATLDFNTIPNKFTALKEPYTKNRNIGGGRIMVFEREDIPSRELITVKTRENIRDLFMEINLRKSKWLLKETYKPPSFSKESFFYITCNVLDIYGKTYDNVILMRNFNTADQDGVLLEFLEDNELSNLVKF